MNAVDLIGVENVELLRAHGFVVVHSQPTEAMIKAGASLGNWHYHGPDEYWHRMVAQSIRTQQKDAISSPENN
jgi:hypothetical protein